MVTMTTGDGGTVTVTRCGELVDIHVRDSSGRTVATVTRRAGEAALLLSGSRRKPQNRPIL
ncbi:hypothetical protein GCM10023084_07680 [Streptomyces lacrimifluminis]|uniref:Uncharacterized protein n=1 Tax=Streptomyces lacrimifluminis TaxID=1500077 RepID=A0A917KS60_9ACTN|nr:hypothetical protein GCM10012282_22200 [Streptomyces lacrimifluminis]